MFTKPNGYSNEFSSYAPYPKSKPEAGSSSSNTNKNVREPIAHIHCPVCDIDLNSGKAYAVHIEGKKHKYMEMRMGHQVEKSEVFGIKPKPPEPEPEEPTEFNCDLCNVTCSSQQQLQIHLEGKNHHKNASLSKKKQIISSNVKKAASKDPSLAAILSKIEQIHSKPKPGASSQVRVSVVDSTGPPDPRQLVEGNHPLAKYLQSSAPQPPPQPEDDSDDDDGGGNVGLGARFKPVPRPEIGPNAMGCEVCNIDVPNQIAWQQHISGIKHIKVGKKE